MGRSIKIYGAHIATGTIHGQQAASTRAGRSHHKAKAIHHAKAAHKKHAKHKKGGPTQTWEQAMSKAGLSL